MLDELIENPRRLGIAHGCFGLVAAIVYWVKPGTFTPHLPVHVFRDFSPIYKTFVAWAPYVLAFFVSKSLLACRSTMSVLMYIFIATAITIGASGLYLNVYNVRTTLPPIMIAGAVTIALIAAAGFCAVVRRRDTVH